MAGEKKKEKELHRMVEIGGSLKELKNMEEKKVECKMAMEGSVEEDEGEEVCLRRTRGRGGG